MVDKSYKEGTYATDLIAFAPKFNFLFIVNFEFFPAYRRWNEFGESAAFVIKTSTRPQIEFEYEEVNLYNFWTKVPKRTIYQPMRMTFYDDNKNQFHKLYSRYIRSMSPIANMIPYPGTNPYDFMEASMDFKDPSSAPTPDNGYAASLGSLAGEHLSIFSRIRLIHVYDYGKFMNVYNFFNPRILEFTPSDLTMVTSGDGAEIEINFIYDSMHPQSGLSTIDTSTGINIKELSANHGTHHFLKRGNAPTTD